MEHEILVPLDGSASAEAVLPQTLLMAHATNSTLHLLRVIPDLVSTILIWPAAIPLEFPVNTPELCAAAQGYSDQIVTALQAQGDSVRTTVVVGDPASTILAWATEHPIIRQIAMTTHGRSGVTRWILGSVAEKVLTATPVPLLLVRASAHHPAATRSTPAPDLALPIYRTIMVPLDGSALAEQALLLASMLARTTSAGLILMHASPPPNDVVLARQGYSNGWDAPHLAQLCASAEEYLGSD